jgi:hypothetical protein
MLINKVIDSYLFMCVNLTNKKIFIYLLLFEVIDFYIYR